MKRQPGAVRRAAFVCLVITLIMSTIGGLTASAAGEQPADPITVTTNYDETTPDQRIRVTLQIEARETTLSNIRVYTSSLAQTLIEPSSFTTQVSPGNHDVPIEPKGNGDFAINELEPGERVTISFAVVPVSLEKASLPAAKFRIRYVRHGQQLEVTRRASADLSQNPWALLQNARQQVNGLKARLKQQRLAFVGGIAVGILGFLFGSATELRRRRSIKDLRDRTEDLLYEAYGDLSPSERPVIERVARRLGIGELRAADSSENELSRNMPTQRSTSSRQGQRGPSAKTDDTTKSGSSGKMSRDEGTDDRSTTETSDDWDPDHLI